MVDLVSLKIRSAFENIDGYSKTADEARKLAAQFEKTEAATRGQSLEADNLAVALARLGKEKGLIDDFKRLSTETESTADALAHAKREVAFLKDGMEKAGKGGAKVFARDLDNAKKKVIKLAESQRRYQKNIKTLQRDMAAAGISAENLASHQARIQRETDGAREKIDRLSGSLQKLRSRTTKPLPDATRRLREGATDTTKALSSMRAQILGLLSVAGLKQMSESVLTASDAWKNYEAQLSLATDTSEEQAKAEKALFDISQDTRTGLDANISLYARVARNRKELNLSQEELLKTTDLLAKGLKISGATTAEAGATTLQLSQALGSGVLRGEELNSVLENGGRVAKALADGLDVSIGALKEMGAQGELNSRKVIAALLSQKEAIDDEFRALPQTVEGSLTKIANRYQQFIGQSEGVGTATRNVIQVLEAVAENFDEVAELAVRTGQFIIAAFAVKGVAAIRAYVAEMVVATAATKALTTATAAQGAVNVAAAGKVAKLGAAIKGIGWTAAIAGLAELAGRVITLRNETKTTAEILEEISNKTLKQASSAELYAAALSAGAENTEEFARQVRAGALAFDETTGKWKAGAEVLDRLALNAHLAGKEIKAVAPSFETDIDVKNSFFAQMMEEVQAVTQEGVPEYISKMTDLRAANLLTDGQLEALRLTLVALQNQIENTGGEVDVRIKQTTFGDVPTFTRNFSDMGSAAETAGNAVGTAADDIADAGSAAADSSSDVDRLIQKNHDLADRQNAAMRQKEGLAEASNKVADAQEAENAEATTGVNLTAIVRQNYYDLSEAAGEYFDEKIKGLTSIREWWHALSDAEFNRVKERYEDIHASVDALTGRIKAGTATQAEMALAAQHSSVVVKELGEERLGALRSALADASSRADALADSARATLEQIQDRVDPEGADARRAAREKTKLEERYQEAVRAGNIEAQELLRQAIELQRQHHDETMGQLAEEEDARRQALNPPGGILKAKQAAVASGQAAVGPAGGVRRPIHNLPATDRPPSEEFLEHFKSFLERWRPPVAKIELDGVNIVKQVERRMRLKGGTVAEAGISDAALALGHRT